MKQPIDPRITMPVTYPKVNGLTEKEEARFVELVNMNILHLSAEAQAKLMREFKRLKRKRWAKDIRNDNIVRGHALELFEALEKLANAAAEITDYSDGKLARAQVKAAKLLTEITDRQLH